MPFLTRQNGQVMENIARKNPRGDVKIDTDMSPFLRERLLLPTLDDQTKRKGPTNTIPSIDKCYAPNDLKKRSGQKIQRRPVGSTATMGNNALLVGSKSQWTAGRTMPLEEGGFHQEQQHQTRVRYGDEEVSSMNPPTRIQPLSPRSRVRRQRGEATAIATSAARDKTKPAAVIRAKLPPMEPAAGVEGVAAVGWRDRTDAGNVGEYSRSRTRVETSASLKTLSLQQMSQEQDSSGRGTEDELERCAYTSCL